MDGIFSSPLHYELGLVKLWVKMSKAPNKMKNVANDLKPT